MSVGDELARRIQHRVRDVPDFPRPGIIFKDITPVLGDATLLGDLVRSLHDRLANVPADLLVAIESRGFIIGAPLAVSLGIAFAPIRKPGKLPYRTVRVSYELEYGTDALEAHVDAVHAGQRVLLVDDVLATGGTAAGAARLVHELGGEVVGAAFVIEPAFLEGRKKLHGFPVESIVRYG
jgi:adenine phosphoribosyltransferase